MNHDHTEARLLTAELANEFALPAMLSSNAYRRDGDRTRFPVLPLGWVRVGAREGELDDGHNSYEPRTSFGRLWSNLQFDIWEHQSRPETCVAFKGTDEKVDWAVSNLAIGISIAYKSAKKLVRLYAEQHPERRILLTGHSLGGGLALSTSLWLGLDAVAFDPSPRLFDGLHDANRPAWRCAVYQQREPLQLIRSVWPKFLEKMNPDDIYRTNFDFRGESSHRMDLLAEGILRMANLQPLEYLAAEVPVKVGLAQTEA